MLSYQHIYHTGNHADILKHMTLLSTLGKLSQKTKPFTVIDTHGGAGLYPVAASEIQRSGEFASGAQHLVDASAVLEHPLLKEYVAVLLRCLQHGELPGSPYLLNSALRENDQMHVCELHPQAFAELQNNIGGKGVNLYQEDSFVGLKRLCPPLIKRGLVLIDPPYEQTAEYSWVKDALCENFPKWPTAAYLLWYPLLSSKAGPKSGLSEQLCHSLDHSIEAKNIAQFELYMTDFDATAVGMFGSGMLCINLPYGCFEEVHTSLNEVVEILNSVSSQRFVVRAKWLQVPN